MEAVRANQGKHLKPCIQYPNPQKASVCWLLTWPKSLFFPHYPRLILPFLGETWSGVINMEPKGRVLGFARLLVVLGFFLWKELWTGFNGDNLGDICIFASSGDNFVTGLWLAIDKGIMVWREAGNPKGLHHSSYRAMVWGRQFH